MSVELEGNRLQELIKPTRWLSIGQQIKKFLSLYCHDILLSILWLRNPKKTQ